MGINQVTLELRPGITGLVGHNGSGKSTLLRLAAGLMRPDLGTVQIAGHDAWVWEAKRHIGYCPELDTFYEEMSGRRFLQTIARLCGYPRRETLRRTEESLTLVGIDPRAGRPTLRAGRSRRRRSRRALSHRARQEPAPLLRASGRTRPRPHDRNPAPRNARRIDARRARVPAGGQAALSPALAAPPRQTR